MGGGPEFLICLDCETPCYTFEWQDGIIREATCMMCGEDDVDSFATEEDFEALSSDTH